MISVDPRRPLSIADRNRAVTVTLHAIRNKRANLHRAAPATERTLVVAGDLREHGFTEDAILERHARPSARSKLFESRRKSLFFSDMFRRAGVSRCHEIVDDVDFEPDRFQLVPLAADLFVLAPGDGIQEIAPDES